MKISAIGVTTTNFKKTIEFYTLLGFEFPQHKDEDHLEAINKGNYVRLMIDSHELIKSIIGKDPKPGNHSSFAIEYNSPNEVDHVVGKLTKAGFTITKEPWDAFWGQHYAIVQDPDGYLVDLYSNLR